MAEPACLMAEFRKGAVGGEGTGRQNYKALNPTFLPTDHLCSIVSQSSRLHLLPLLIKKKTQRTASMLQTRSNWILPRRGQGAVPSLQYEQNLSFLRRDQLSAMPTFLVPSQIHWSARLPRKNKSVVILLSLHVRSRGCQCALHSLAPYLNQGQGPLQLCYSESFSWKIKFPNQLCQASSILFVYPAKLGE